MHPSTISLRVNDTHMSHLQLQKVRVHQKNPTLPLTVSNPFHVVCPILIVGGIIQSILSLYCLETLKRQHPPDYLDSTKRLKPDDIFSEYLLLLATTCSRSQFTSPFDTILYP